MISPPLIRNLSLQTPSCAYLRRRSEADVSCILAIFLSSAYPSWSMKKCACFVLALVAFMVAPSCSRACGISGCMIPADESVHPDVLQAECGERDRMYIHIL